VTMDKWVCASVSLCDMKSSRTLKTKTLNHEEPKKKKKKKKKKNCSILTLGLESPDCNSFSLSQLEKETQPSTENKAKRGTPS
jgi:hypothetical protein